MVKIWPYSHMAIWHQMWLIWVSMERAIKMQHSDGGIRSIGPSCKKWEQKLSDDKFSFVFFENSFVFTKIGGHTTKMVILAGTSLLRLSVQLEKALAQFFIILHS